MIQHPALLIVLDGVGEYKEYPGNAVKNARTPFLDSLYRTYPWTLLEASGNAVGLPDKNQGGSEPGHLTMGAGRIVWQPMEEINQSIKQGDFFEKKEFLDAIQFAKKQGGTLHLIGMISDAGVHSHVQHLYALLRLAKQEGIEKVLIHGITDGRDVPEQSAKEYIQQIHENIEQIGIGTLATLVGRYYGMDRDKNFDRTKIAYDLLVHGIGNYVQNAEEGLDHFYATADDLMKTDYYLTPLKLINQPSFVQPGDSIIFFNFRSDRAEQLTETFANNTFQKFEQKESCYVPHISFVCMGPYSQTLPIAFPPVSVTNNLGSVIAQKGLRQLRIAETEKYAHVTFFFNSQIEAPCEQEDRILIPSPKVPSYAQKPEMSAIEITERLLQEIRSEHYDFILTNFANGDLVGHSGVYNAAVQAMETLDQCLAQIIPLALEKKYTVIITADHGNAEYMINEDGSQNPSHGINPVRAVIIQPEKTTSVLPTGCGLSSLAPTILTIMGIAIPQEMTGTSLL